MCVLVLSRVQLFVTPWIAVCQAPPPTEFYRQEHLSGLPFPSPINYMVMTISQISAVCQVFNTIPFFPSILKWKCSLNPEKPNIKKLLSSLMFFPSPSSDSNETEQRKSQYHQSRTSQNKTKTHSELS